MKEKLVSRLKEHLREIDQLKRSISRAIGVQVEKTALKSAAHAVASRWFDEIKPVLDGANADADVIAAFSKLFESLMVLSRRRSTKKSYLDLIQSIIPAYEQQLIHAAEIGTFVGGPALSIAPYLAGLPTEEGTYLDEAQRCLSVNALKGCIVLGWCATIARIHEQIGRIGFDKFSKATEQMVARDYGRYKPFKKKMMIDSLSELQRVFDTDLLWVLEYLELIDSNQHQRLRTCFELRNHCAHPGQAPVEPENVYAFYSDITKIVLKNPNFS
jgi:hypothetical protein